MAVGVKSRGDARVAESWTDEAQRASAGGLWELDLRSQELHLTPPAGELCGLEPGRAGIPRELLLQRIHPEDHAAWLEGLARAGEQPGPFEVEFRYQHPTLGPRWLLALGRGLPSERPERALGLLVDITERKRREDEREERARELAAANRAKDLFFNTLSHELRTPLAAIMNAVEVLRQAELPKSQRTRLLGIIDRNVRHQTRLVDDLLDLSRIMRGRLQLERERLDMREVVSAQAEALEPDALRAGIRLELKLPQRTVPVHGDAVRLGQIIQNLLGNAVKFSERGGQVELQLALDGDSVVLSVRDNGIGIPPELMPRLFEPFGGERPQARGRAGLGIGLTIASSLAELHGGTLEAHSEGAGRGATFFLRLPGLREEAGAANGGQLRISGRRVLVVDDNPDLRDTLSLLLELAGHAVYTAEDGANALEVAGRVRPDLALIDIGLPDFDGHEVARRLRAEPVLAGLQLIALTGFAGEEHRAQALAAGFDEFLAKPVDPDRLLQLLEKPRR